MRALLLLLVTLLGCLALASAGPLAVDREWYTSQTLPEGDLFSDFKLQPDQMRVEAMVSGRPAQRSAVQCSDPRFDGPHQRRLNV